MMRSPGTWAVTVRRADGGLARVCRPISSAAARHRWMRLPIIRGVVALGESLVIGFRALSVSATYASIQPGEEADPEEAAELTRGQIAFAFVIAIGFALVIFKVSPAVITGFLPIHSTALFVVVEGGIRVSFLIAVPGADLARARPAPRLPVPRGRAQGDQRLRGRRRAHAGAGRSRTRRSTSAAGRRSCSG